MDLFSLLETLDRLKHLKRTGWVHHGVREPETVASHMYRMAVLAMTLAEHRSDLDMAKCVQMALVHDIGEAIIGDITPHCGVSEKEKQEIERNAVEEIAGFVPNSIGQNWLALWEEYEAAVTPEAKAVKQLDKFDMIAQALSYEQRYQMDLSEFFESTQNAFTEQPFLGWAKQVRDKHSALMLAKHAENGNGRNDAGNN